MSIEREARVQEGTPRYLASGEPDLHSGISRGARAPGLETSSNS